MINETRIKEHFLDLVQIDSEAGNEAAIAELLRRQLVELGASVAQDQAGRGINSNSGNIIATLPGTMPGAASLLLCAHMDTVVPGNGITPVIEGSIIHSDGTTILGSDDKSGIAIIFEAIRAAREQRVPIGDLEIVFTICEEKGLQGARGYPF